jgi:type II secretory pathway pseudopilin PulG
MIELLLVIGILLVLISMFFIGLRYVTQTAQVRDTKAALETAKAMLNEYQEATHLNRPPTPLLVTYWTGQETLPLPSATTPWAIGPITPPTSSTAASPAYSNPNVTLGVDTAYVMYALEQMPANQTIITNLPANKKLVSSVSINEVQVQVTFLLDSWGNVILFVPSGGLANVRFGGQTSTVTGQSAVGTTETAGGNSITITSPDSRPFFVSAGPDGDVSLGDDNVYSFQ